MNPLDLAGLAIEALRAHRTRFLLSALAVAVGIASVTLLSSIGEGTRQYVFRMLGQFGSTIVGIHPGRLETGGLPGAVGGSARKLTLDDAAAIARLPGALGVVAAAYGTAEVSWHDRARRVYVLGTTGDVPRVWSMPVATGRFLPASDWHRRAPVVVLGPRLARELFGSKSPLGQAVRIDGARYRVVGVMGSKETYLGLDLDDTAYVTAADAMALFGLAELSEINALAATTEAADSLAARAHRLMIRRHDRDDVTVVTWAEASAMVTRIMNVVTASVTGIAAISLLVGAIGILTILWIVVRERTPEIGLVKALGARRVQILAWFLLEAVATGAAGGVAGLLLGLAGAATLSAAVPGIEIRVTGAAVLVALAASIGVGILAGVAPAARAARLDPIEALREE